MSLDGTLTVESPTELARPGSFDFSVAKFLSSLKENKRAISEVTSLNNDAKLTCFGL